MSLCRTSPCSLVIGKRLHSSQWDILGGQPCRESLRDVGCPEGTHHDRHGLGRNQCHQTQSRRPDRAYSYLPRQESPFSLRTRALLCCLPAFVLLAGGRADGYHGKCSPRGSARPLPCSTPGL